MTQPTPQPSPAPADPLPCGSCGALNHPLAVDELDRFEALAQVRAEAKTSPWIATDSIATSAYHTSAIGQFQE